MNAALRERLIPRMAACGSLTVRIEGETARLRCSGAMWLPEHGVLVAGDLHLEKGSAFAARGQMLPPYDSRATLDRLEAEIAILSPRAVVLLGDSFHDTRSIGRMAAEDRARLDVMAGGRDWVWGEGNHDREALLAPSPLPGVVVESLTIGALTLTHEPLPEPHPGEVAGHLHPCARVVRHGRGVRRACFLTDGRRIILPAFGAFTGGLSVRDPAFHGMFEHPPMAAALGRDRVHALPWSAVG